MYVLLKYFVSRLLRSRVMITVAVLSQKQVIRQFDWPQLPSPQLLGRSRASSRCGKQLPAEPLQGDHPTRSGKGWRRCQDRCHATRATEPEQSPPGKISIKFWLYYSNNWGCGQVVDTDVSWPRGPGFYSSDYQLFFRAILISKIYR